MTTVRTRWGAIALWLAAAAAAAGEGTALQAGVGEGDGIRRAGIGLSVPGVTGLPCEPGCAAGQYWLLRADRWWRPRYRGGDAALWDLSVMPVLRFGAQAPSESRLFVELGVGVHWLTASEIGHKRFFGSTFQFGERFAVGYAFGPARRQALVMALEHVSNGGLDVPNNGATFLGAAYRVDWR